MLACVLKKQASNTMTIVGAMVSAIYIMRVLGFNDPLPWSSSYYPLYVVSLFIGLVLKEIYTR